MSDPNRTKTAKLHYYHSLEYSSQIARHQSSLLSEIFKRTQLGRPPVLNTNWSDKDTVNLRKSNPEDRMKLRGPAKFQNRGPRPKNVSRPYTEWVADAYGGHGPSSCVEESARGCRMNEWPCYVRCMRQFEIYEGPIYAVFTVPST